MAPPKPTFNAVSSSGQMSAKLIKPVSSPVKKMTFIGVWSRQSKKQTRSCLTPGHLNFKTLLFQERLKPFPLFALNFDHPIFDCTAGSTKLLELLGQAFKRAGVEWQAGNQG